MISEDRLEPLRSEDLTPEEMLLEDEWRHSLRSAISLLLPPEREIIELIYFKEMSCRAAAKTLGWGHSKADRNHHRVLRRLRQFSGLDRIYGAPPGRPSLEVKVSP